MERKRKEKKQEKIAYFKFGDSPAVTQNYDYGSYGLLSAYRFSQGKKNNEGLCTHISDYTYVAKGSLIQVQYVIGTLNRSEDFEIQASRQLGKILKRKKLLTLYRSQC